MWSENDILYSRIDENWITFALALLAGITLLVSWKLIDREIRRRAKANSQLQKSRARFQAILDHAPMTVVVKDLEGRYTFVNRRLEQWTDQGSSSLLGKTIRDLFGDTDYAREHDALDQEILETKKPIQREFTTPHPTAP